MAASKDTLDRLHELRSAFDQTHERFTVALRRFIETPDSSEGTLTALNEAIRSHRRASEAYHREAHRRASDGDFEQV